ncbi:hypothetical protein A5697_20315 [Mycobacterium sp. E3251]|uniref:hypothetical protein n=1 Tax=Mycobacterium sp. E3251 TaxID=1834144 RepID=UPI00080134DB|nr:hypothetical protein [Mycobacterium sp. E3251]OBG96904.1 hypothetical protein A5697_20315 [Mycobacterium sp. E3251]
MNATTVESVLRVLEGAGYERLPKPLIVAGSIFDFDAAVKGTGVSHDLVVLATTDNSQRRLLRLLSALSRTLDQVESTRPVSLVLIGETVDARTLANLEQHSRVLTIDSNAPRPEDIRRAVAVLLPLKLPAEQSVGPPPLTLVVERLGAAASEEHQRFIEAAEVGPDEVRESLRRYIDAAADGELNERSDS